jgi:D-alanyl-D-alanine carboxypeptidase
MYKKYIQILLIICFLLNLIAGTTTAAQTLPVLSVEAAVLLDWQSGRILYARNPHLPRPMASITKIMTAILALWSVLELRKQAVLQFGWRKEKRKP